MTSFVKYIRPLLGILWQAVFHIWENDGIEITAYTYQAEILHSPHTKEPHKGLQDDERTWLGTQRW